MLKTETKLLAGVLIFCVVLVLGAIFFLGKSEKTPDLAATKALNIDYSKGQKIGSDSAKVKLVEFSDLQCPACKGVEPFVKQVLEKHKDNLQFIYRHFPLTQHIHSKKAANFAEFAATQNKFWEVHDKLFDNQEEWSGLSDPTDYFANLGSQFGLDKEKIKEAVSKGLFEQIINDDQTDGNILGVDATPTFYLNGKKLRLQSFAGLDKVVTEGLQQN